MLSNTNVNPSASLSRSDSLSNAEGDTDFGEMQNLRNLFLAWVMSMPADLSIQKEAERIIHSPQDQFWNVIPSHLKGEMEGLLRQVDTGFLLSVPATRRRSRRVVH